ncbi:MAG: hypothetical protein HWD63_14065 [Candidatus Parvibacillus calidus]|nr:MAG: hypothetical protein HWD63_14065 [Candidatus Parvibacillus calidus]
MSWLKETKVAVRGERSKIVFFISIVVKLILICYTYRERRWDLRRTEKNSAKGGKFFTVWCKSSVDVGTDRMVGYQRPTLDVVPSSFAKLPTVGRYLGQQLYLRHMT